MGNGKGKTFDLVVIGAGAAGGTVAASAAERGLSVALVEKSRVGGACLDAGCDPTMALARSAAVAHLARSASQLGVTVGDVRVDWREVRAGVRQVIEGLDGERGLREQRVSLIREHGRFVDANTVVAGDHRMRGERFLIATGARTTTPSIDGLAATGFVTSADVPDIEALPASLAIVGSGPTGVEFAQIFARLGVDVTLVGTRSRILPREEPALAGALLDVLRDEGVRWEPELRIEGATRRDGFKVIQGTRDGATVEIAAEEIMIATGRTPNIERLGLDDAGIQANDHCVIVDSYLLTTNPGVYAAGDVTGIYPFTHVAEYQARIVEHNLFDEEQPLKADYRVVPWVIYTDPELARVGLTEEEARAGGYDVVSVTMPFDDLPRALTLGDRRGMATLVVDREHGVVLGGHVLGSRAGDLVGEIAVVMEHRLPVAAIAGTIHPYPTMSEGVFWAACQAASEVVDSPARMPARP